MNIPGPHIPRPRVRIRRRHILGPRGPPGCLNSPTILNESPDRRRGLRLLPSSLVPAGAVFLSVRLGGSGRLSRRPGPRRLPGASVLPSLGSPGTDPTSLLVGGAVILGLGPFPGGGVLLSLAMLTGRGASLSLVRGGGVFPSLGLFPGGGVFLSLVRGGGVFPSLGMLTGRGASLSLFPGGGVFPSRRQFPGGAAWLNLRLNLRLSGGGWCGDGGLSLRPGLRRAPAPNMRPEPPAPRSLVPCGDTPSALRLGGAVVRSPAAGGPAGRAGAGPDGFAGWPPVASSSPVWPRPW
jgi:hypothetical protein